MAYFLISYLCITGPIAAWAILSQDERLRRVVFLAGYVSISLLLVMLVGWKGERIDRFSSDLLVKSAELGNLPVGCSGSLDEAVAGLRYIHVPGKRSFQAGAGRKLVLRGWIGSELSQTRPPTVRLVSGGGRQSFAGFATIQQPRPDVVAATAIPMLERSGFQAEAVLPSDLPPGNYEVVVECCGLSRTDQFVPGIVVEVVPVDLGAVLDAPFERELAEQKRKEAQAAAQPVPTVTPSKKSKRSKNKECDGASNRHGRELPGLAV